MEEKLSYRQAGVDVEAGYDVVRRIKNLVGSVQPPSVMGGIGAFGGLFALPGGYQEPVLVSGCDGVGTKIIIAREANLLESIGIDLVAMSVNDIAAMGAKPLFFLDYLAVGKLVPSEAERILTGIVAGCKQADCALLGGETAEMPGVYDPGEFDLAGFAVGIVEKSRIITGGQIEPGDILVGLPSSGLHSNGFSLVRKICFSQPGWTVETRLPGLDMPLGELLLTPTKIYVPVIQSLLDKVNIRGIAHITGGGLPENVGRIIPPGLVAQIDSSAWPTLPVFSMLAQVGAVEKNEMFHAFNMGIGMVLVISPDEVKTLLKALEELGEEGFVLGTVAPGEGGVNID